MCVCLCAYVRVLVCMHVRVWCVCVGVWCVCLYACVCMYMCMHVCDWAWEASLILFQKQQFYYHCL